MEPTMTETVRVELGERSYDIVIGPNVLASAGTRIKAILPRARCAIVTDENVAALHLTTLSSSLDEAGIVSKVITVPPGEATKSIEHLNNVVEAIIEMRLERGDIVIAFGGGIVGDLAGFAASIVRRGMNFVQIPTSLLAQVDSSVGGKTGINSPQGKNLIGAFHQPKLVLADTALLNTLSGREFRAGFAEVIKYGLINDAAFFDWLENNWDDIASNDQSGHQARVHAVATSCRAKAAIVARDEFETGDRALLNLGHTFGHALEGITKYRSDILVHGEGVAIGMVLAHAFSARLNQASTDDTRRVKAYLKRVGLPTDLSHLKGHIKDADHMLDFIMQDKKVVRGDLTFILTKGIGQSYVAKDVPVSEVRAFLAQELES
ncbi:MAG: 3-dehydroquinate synthase [Ahrensia sp.]|nr:3-dehydroquinate synthase [Ahrensia sp.]